MAHRFLKISKLALLPTAFDSYCPVFRWSFISCDNNKYIDDSKALDNKRIDNGDARTQTFTKIGEGE
jgi:hypothetical protein